MKIDFFGTTNTGMVRSNNEDSFIAQYIDDESKVLCMAIDGIGGYEGGEVAAEITRQTVINYLEENRNGSMIERLKRAFTEANNEICKQAAANPQLNSMGCVATACVIDPETETITIAHVGDTRLYRSINGQLCKLTHDHSLIGFREESGQLTELEAMNHPNRNLIERSLGERIHQPDDPNFIEAGYYAIDESCIMLLCSDGLCDMITSAQMSAELNFDDHLSDIADRLVDKANQAGGRDNITVVLARIETENKKTAQQTQTQLSASATTSPANSQASNFSASKPTASTSTVPDSLTTNQKSLQKKPLTTIDAGDDDDDDFSTPMPPMPKSNRVNSRTITIALCAAVAVFFGGYFAAIGVANKKANSIEDELKACRQTLQSYKTENEQLADSIKKQQQQIIELQLTVDALQPTVADANQPIVTVTESTTANPDL